MRDRQCSATTAAAAGAAFGLIICSSGVRAISSRGAVVVDVAVGYELFRHVRVSRNEAAGTALLSHAARARKETSRLAGVSATTRRASCWENKQLSTDTATLTVSAQLGVPEKSLSASSSWLLRKWRRKLRAVQIRRALLDGFVYVDVVVVVVVFDGDAIRLVAGCARCSSHS